MVGILGVERPNDTGVVQALRQLGVGASDEGRGSLMDSMVVVVLMALLRVAEHAAAPIRRASRTLPLVGSGIPDSSSVGSFGR